MKASNHLLKFTFVFAVVLILFVLQKPCFSQIKKPSSQSIINKNNGQKQDKIKLNIKDFGAKGDGATNDVAAFETAKKQLQQQGGGIIYFPAGKYMSDENGWNVFANNITLQGAGIDKTFLLTPDNTNAPGLRLAPYRDAGWNNAPEQQYAYENETKEGDNFIKLKAGQDVSAFKPGTIFFLSAGASYYDQYYGEFNIADKVTGNTIYLKYPLCKDYSTGKSAWYGTLTAAFTPPAIHKTAVATTFRGPQKLRASIAISLGNELYKIIAINGDKLTLENMGKGNRPETIPAGAHIFKARSIRIAPSASYNVAVEGMTIVGHPKAVVVSNTVKTVFNNVKFISKPGLKTGGIWLDGDDGRDCTITNCIAQSDSITGSQFARSFSDIKILHSIFLQTGVDFTEFNAHCEVANCTFTIKSPDGSNRSPNNPAITVGGSTYNTYIHDNTFTIYRRVAAIASQPDIQTFSKNRLGKTLIEHNTIHAEKCGSFISVNMLGDTRINKNILSGSVPFMFGKTGASLYADETLGETERQDLIAHSICRITNNTFKGYTDDFFSRDANNVIIEGNTVRSLGQCTPGGNKLALANGNIVPGSTRPDSLPPLLFVLRNNTFTGWNYRENSINFNKPINKNVDITNNRFINNTGTFKKEKDFTISLTK